MTLDCSFFFFQQGKGRKKEEKEGNKGKKTFKEAKWNEKELVRRDPFHFKIHHFSPQASPSSHFYPWLHSPYPRSSLVITENYSQWASA